MYKAYRIMSIWAINLKTCADVDRLFPKKGISFIHICKLPKYTIVKNNARNIAPVDFHLVSKDKPRKISKKPDIKWKKRGLGK